MLGKQACNLVSTKKRINKTNAIVAKMCHSFLDGWFQPLRTLPQVFFCAFFESRLQISELKSWGVSTGPVNVKTIVVFITHVQYFTAQQHASWETPEAIIA